jgi:peptide/nickel transport system substrate-binding protein
MLSWFKGISLAVLAVTLAACASGPGAPSASTSAQPEVTKSSAPKILNLVGNEPIVIGNFPGVRGGTGAREGIPNEYLTMVDPRGEVIPRLAQETISVEKGTWRVNPDGSMDTTWKLRPNIKWQDGTPFTIEDLMFTYTVYKDPAMPSYYGAALNMMTAAEVVDPQTMVIHWSKPYFQANLAPGLDPMPRHILEPVYLADKTSFDTHAFFRQEYIGTGPYRIKEWVEGAHIIYERNEHYYLGRPPLDTVILHFIKDKNTVLANVLAGTLDVIFYKDALDVDAALELRDRWAGTGNNVTFIPTERLISIEIQSRKEIARPQLGGIEREVRQAMMHALDRPTLVESVTHGLSPVADHWITPSNRLAEAAKGAVPTYPYDVNRAQQMLTRAGWVKGSDGILVHQTTGERFDFDLWNRFLLTKEQAIVADYWKAVGINVNIKQYLQNDRELQVSFTGGQTMDQTIQDFTVARLRTADIAAESNRYSGRNVAGYSNPRFDDLLNRLHVSIDPQEQTRINVDLAREAFTDLPELPLYFLVTPMALRQGWSGSVPGAAAGLYWDLYSWDKQN